MPKTYVFRLTAEGVRELERDLKSLGASGERAFDEMSKRVPGLSGALNDANRRLDEHRTRLAEAGAEHARMGTNLAGLITRYATWATVIITARNAMNSAAETNAEAAAAMEKLDKAWGKFALSAAQILTPAVDKAAELLEEVSDLYTLLSDGKWDQAWANFWRGFSEATSVDISKLPADDPRRAFFAKQFPGVNPTPGVTGGIIGDTRATFNKITGDYTPGPYGFPGPPLGEGVTDLTAQEAAAKRARDLADKELKDKLARIQQEYEWYVKFYADKKALADKDAAETKARQAKLNDDIHSQLIELSQQGLDVEKRHAEERQKVYDDDDKKALERQAKIEGYWLDTLNAMTADGQNFFEHFFETGEGGLKEFIDVFKRAWARLFADLAAQQVVAPLMRSVLAQMGPLVGQVAGGAAPAGLLSGGGGSVGALGLGAGLGLGGLGAWLGGSKASFDPTTGDWTPGAGGFGGGGAFAYQGFGVGSALGGAAAGAGLGSMLGMVGGNTTGGTIGGALGGAIGSIWGPLGTMAGSALGGLVGGMFGGKPSNYRATATFGAGGYALSGDKPNEQTLGLAQQAAAAIMAEVEQLKAFGVEFQQELSNIWIGQRDASTFQLVGGQRVGVGTVGDPGDLAADAINALLKGATSSDPTVAAQLGRGYASIDELKQALQFASGIGTALKQITDPLGAAIDVWKKEAQARLDMAAATGVSIDKVQQLNAALWQQQFGQVNAGLVSSIGGYIQQLHYGPESSATPNQQYAAALKEYEASRAAAMAGGAPEAQKYLEMTQSFLPIAREYLGTTQAYAQIQSTAETTLQSLAQKLAAPPMPELVTPIVQATTAVGAATVDAIEAVQGEIRTLGERLDRMAGGIESLMRAKSAV